LLEVLVSIVILSFGVLGVVGLQAASLQANREARYQAAAVRLGRELAEMMRGNKTVAVQTGTAANPYLLPDTSLPVGTAIAASPENCFSAPCTSGINVAKFEMAEWQQRVRDELPNARVAVCFDQTPYNGTTGRPQWTCTAGTSGVIVLKLGWTQRTTDRRDTGLAALDQATTPTVVLPLTAGSTE
jgi:type IV pilus assembly protein PilV